MRSGSFSVVRTLFAILFIVALGLTARSQTNTPITAKVTGNCGGYMEYLPAGYGTNTTKKYPTIVYIHGLASFGAGTTASLLTMANVEGVPKYIANGQFPRSIVTPYGDTASFIAISPQFKSNPSTPTDIKAVIDYVLAHYRVDPYRLYLTGYSLGGGAVWQAPFNLTQAKRLAAMVPVAAYDLPFYDTTAQFIAGANVAVWAIHSTADQTAPYTTDVTFVAKLDSLNPRTKAILTLVPGLSHDSTVSAVYNPTFRPNGKNIYEWMLQYAKFYPPTAIVGKDTSFVLPANSLTLSGSHSTDPQNETLAYQWARTTGPAQFTISNAAAANPVISGLLAGKYSFTLTITDSAGLTSTATQNVYVINPNGVVPPVANAGNDTTILLPGSSSPLNGNGSSAPNGAIESYAWTQLSGPTQAVIANPAAATTTASNLRSGTYQFQLSIVDNLDSTAKSTVHIHVVNPFPNIAPFARAGADQTISLPTNSITFNASTSSDTDGVITSYRWRQLNGPAQSTITTPNVVSTTVTNLVAGVYQFELSVQDDSSATGRDTIAVFVNPIPKLVQVNVFGGSNPAGTGWNNWNVSSGLSSAAFLYSDGTTSVIKAVLSANTAIADNGASYPTTMCPPAVGRTCSYFYTPRTLVISGLDSNNKYNFEAYDTRPGGQSNTWSFGSSKVTITVNNNYANKVTFNGLTPTAGKLTFNITGSYNYVNGFTLTELGSATSGTLNKAPVSVAGADQSINLPVNQVTVNGSGSHDPDGSISAYSWQQVSGPAPATFTTPNVASTTITGLDSGTYIIQLTVTDNKGAVSTSTLTVTVGSLGLSNKPPVANAGPDLTVDLPVDSIQLNGSASYDPDGTITKYTWAKIAGPTPYTISSTTTAKPIVANLYAGAYQFVLTVTDNNGATAKDTVAVFVTATPPIPPVANDGANINLSFPNDTTTLDGSASYDRDTTIVSYLWREVSGPAQYTFNDSTIVKPTVSNLAGGTYVFELNVTDANGLTAKDSVTVTVKPDLPPVSAAGTDTSITLPASSVQLNGNKSSDPDGSIARYRWTLISGPASHKFSDSTIVNPVISNLTTGIYSISLTVTDNLGVSTTDTMIITVSPPRNTPPAANAGPDQTIILPTSSTVLNGSASKDNDGTIIAYAWRQLNGPSTSTLDQPDGLTTDASNLAAGAYSFELTVTDDSLATSRDTVTVTVKANLPPVSAAGTNVSITLPTSSVQLNGNKSGDPDGNITAYSWSVISGPASYKFSDSTLVNPVISNLSSGVYLISLTVTDNLGAIAVDTMIITVSPPRNIPPVANAGPDQTIILPTSSTVLNGSASKDNDGTIIAYAWRQLNGPSTSTLDQPDSLTTDASNLVAGDYSFELTVIDDSLADSRDTVLVNVSTATRQIKVNVYGGSTPAGAGWNNWNVSSSLTSAALLYADGGTSTITAKLSENTGVADNGASYATTMCPKEVGRTTAYDWNQRTLTIAGLSAGKVYNIEFYDSRTGGNQNTYTIGKTSMYVNPNNNFATKVVFNSLTTTTGSIVVTLFGQYNYLNGFTLTENAAQTGTATGGSLMSSSTQSTFSGDTASVVTVFPNPSKDQVQVRIDNAVTGRIRLLLVDGSGHVLRESEYTKEGQTLSETLNVDDLPTGVYFIRILMEAWQRTIPVIKQR